MWSPRWLLGLAWANLLQQWRSAQAATIAISQTFFCHTVVTSTGLNWQWQDLWLRLATTNLRMDKIGSNDKRNVLPYSYCHYNHSDIWRTASTSLPGLVQAAKRQVTVPALRIAPPDPATSS